MNIIAVDDERPALRRLEKSIMEASPDCSLACFSTAVEALDYAKETAVDIAFLDIHMPGMNGLEFAKALSEIHEKTNVLFVTGYGEHALDAISMGASGYIIKPPDAESITLELGRLRYPIQTNSEPRVRIQCFGNFSVFVDGKPLVITREKSKELLAFLVHRHGSFVRSAEIAAILWEDTAQGNNANVRQVISRLMKILKDAGIDDIILRDWDNIAIDVEKISCDYYDFLNQKTDGSHSYAGEYMSEYSWAEFTAGYLDNKI